ncbi:hypothetical protein ACOMHN_001748 [Nucella lapillus]
MAIAKKYRVVCGEHIRSQDNGYKVAHRVETVISHPEYNSGPGAYPNDIAVLKLVTPLEFTDYVRCFYFSDGNDHVYVNKISILSGWGRLGGGQKLANSLKKVEMRTLSNYECRRTWGGSINDGHICFLDQGKGSCNVRTFFSVSA